MRVLLLAALAATGFAAHHETNCDADCTTAIYLSIKTANPEAAGYKDGDVAVYGYLLYKAYVTAQNMDGATGADGITYVNDFFEGLGTICAENDFDADKKSGMVDCLAAAEQKQVDDFEAMIADRPTGEQDVMKMLVGAIANQLAPDSVLAEEYDGITEDQFKFALQVYYVVGAFYEGFAAIEEPGVFADDAAKLACYTAIGTAVGYVDGADFPLALVTKAAEGAAAFKDAACFGENLDTPGGAAAGDDFTTALQTKVGGLADDVVAAEATVEKLEAAGPGPATKTADESPAAALSAAVAFLAMML